MTSMTLRVLLARYHGVIVGAHSYYGSLLTPGMADPDTTIGRYVSIGPGVRRFGAAHPTDRMSMHPYWYRSEYGYCEPGDDVDRSGLVIGHDSWIGANVLILPGCSRIGVGAVVGAGSVVTRDVEDFAVVVGSPARVRSMRLKPAHQQRLLDAAPWELPPRAYRAALDEIANAAD